MSYEHCTTESRKLGSHLTSFERGCIEALLVEKRPVSYIAKHLGVHRSTIYREIKRGTVEQKNSYEKKYTHYFGTTAQIRYKQNRARSKKSFQRIEAQAFVDDVVALITGENYSVDAAVGRLKRFNYHEHTCVPRLSTTI